MELIRSGEFDQWLRQLRDRRAVARIAARLDRLAVGNPGDVKAFGEVCRSFASNRAFLLLLGGPKRAYSDALIPPQQASLPGAPGWLGKRPWRSGRPPTPTLKMLRGPGCRVYFLQRGLIVVALLCGADTSTQDKDIQRAKKIAEEWRN